MPVSVDRMRGFHIFADLTERELGLIAEYAREEIYPPAKRIIEEGSLATNLYLVERGRVSIKMRADTVAQQLEVETVGPGEIFGWSAVAKPYTFTAAAWTVEETKVIVLSGDVLRDIFKKNPHIGYLVMKEIASVISERLKAMREKFVELVHRFEKKTGG